MMRRISLAAAALVAAHLISGSAVAQPKADVKEPTWRFLAEALERTLDTKGLQEKLKFKTALEHLNDQFAGKLPIIVDREAFAAELGAEAIDPYEEEVSLPPVPAKMRASQALRLLLSQVGRGEAVYLIRNGCIEVTTAKRAAPEALLAYPISARFDKKSLEDAIEALCEQSGATVVIDARVGDKAKTPVSATFRGTIALEGAVRLLAEMADLQADVRENVLFITNTPKTDGQQQKTELHFKSRRLDLAVKDLAAWSGQTILLDPAYIPPATLPYLPFGGRPQPLLTAEPHATGTKVTASFKPNVSAKAAAEIIARQANLSVVVMDNLIYITRPVTREGFFDPCAGMVQQRRSACR